MRRFVSVLARPRSLYFNRAIGSNPVGAGHGLGPGITASLGCAKIWFPAVGGTSRAAGTLLPVALVATAGAAAAAGHAASQALSTSNVCADCGEIRSRTVAAFGSLTIAPETNAVDR